MTPEQEAFLFAGIELLRRCGLVEWQIRYQDDQQPTIWITAGRFDTTSVGGGAGWKLGSGLGPNAAIVDLLEDTLDGGECRLCGSVMSLIPPGDLALPLPGLCQVRYMPGQGWRRTCEGASN